MKILTAQQFEEKTLKKIVNRGTYDFDSVLPDVEDIVRDVATDGDDAIIRYTKKFDKVNLTKERIKVKEREVEESFTRLTQNEIEALKRAIKNIERFHRAQLKLSFSLCVTRGVRAGRAVRPLSSVGIYAPGGRASYPSSVLMCAVPAKVAGVERILVCSPPTKNGDVDPKTIVAAKLAGATDLFRVGGPQAIAAMAYGTQIIQQVDKIVGPGNVFVTAAKILVRTKVAIDLPAGPSEILVLADETADPKSIALDLIAQTEHDPYAVGILMTTSKRIAKATIAIIDRELKSLPRRSIVKAALVRTGAIIIMKSLDKAIDYVNFIAPEHLEIMTRDPWRIFNQVRNAGAVFLGKYSPTALGDYCAGTNHVLPAGGYARMYSGLSIRDFLKTIEFLQCTKQGLVKLRKTAFTLAMMEGLEGHARSIASR